MSEEYPLTLEHVKQFLATKQDDDEIGICFNAMYCLLSETLNWLYPERKWRVDIGSYDDANIHIGLAPGDDLRLDERLVILQQTFDFSRPSNRDKTVTKAQLRDHLAYFTAERYEPVPFTVADLFDAPTNVAEEQVEW